ncbi:hypothetical protein XI03_25810 [Bradyrhizobium sp. CCBAU 65884]|uniref:hypothetical protein n=1 Tax=Bradyrhizobium sp. CCBAU 65884 TaxID=722477 RepID=UPI0023062328|nr:hypothetical protein [Bradyrhizobium sp. CCBAU 65884]MDA9477836.1 hypothetical protein [Bradyrhizobium sp. CCBAU 65884]
MITLTISSDAGQRFVVRFQSKAGINADGSIVWTDSAVTTEVGQSQRYGLDESFRLIVEASPENANG